MVAEYTRLGGDVAREDDEVGTICHGVEPADERPGLVLEVSVELYTVVGISHTGTEIQPVVQGITELFLKRPLGHDGRLFVHGEVKEHQDVLSRTAVLLLLPAGAQDEQGQEQYGDACYVPCLLHHGLNVRVNVEPFEGWLST